MTKTIEQVTQINNNEYTEIVQKFSSQDFFKNSQKLNIEDPVQKDEIIKNIKYDLIEGNLDSLLADVLNGTKQDLIAMDNNVIYQITSTENQQNKTYQNISTINIGDCEKTLKDIYHIDYNLSLIIFKVDYYMPGLLIPVIGYEIYHPTNKSQLDLHYCNDKKVQLNIPVTINEDNLFKHDPKSEYYNDKCNTYTTDNGTDILLNDRQNEYINNNLSLCENNCSYNGYNNAEKKALCKCEKKLEIGLITDIIKNEEVLSNDFNSTDDTNSNLATMKCIETLFSINGLLTNIGSYLLFFSFVFFSISLIIFYKCGYQLITNELSDLIKAKKPKKEKKIDIYSKRNSKSLKKHKKKHSNPTRRKSKNVCIIKGKKKEQNQITSSKLKIKCIDIELNLKKNKPKKVKSNKKEKMDQSNNKILKVKKFEEYELNSFHYKKALKYDYRTLSQYFRSLLLFKHIIIFSFSPKKDYNLRIIKLSILVLSMDIHFVVNAFFFNDSAIHQIYEDKGKYNFSFFLPYIILSFIISYFCICFIKYFSLSEKYFIEIKNEEDIIKAEKMISSSKQCLTIKYIIFYTLCFMFQVIFWYYLSSFCAVFKNTQIYLSINSFISFILSIIFPIIYDLIPSVIRLHSFKAKNECLYKLSIILQLIS